MDAKRKSISEMARRLGLKRPAQAMVEFGLALPILLLVMYGLLESGRLLFMYASVVSAARQAVRYGSVTGENGSGVRFYNDCAGIRNAAKRLGFLQPIDDARILISYDSGPGTAVLASNCPLNVAGHPINGDRIRVDVSTDFTPIVPLVPFDPFTIASSGTRTLLVGVSIAVDVPGVVLTPGGTGAMALFKDATPASFDAAGDIISYRYTITNLGGSPIVGISVTDDKVSSQGHTVNCSAVPNPLVSGASGTCTATYVVTQADVLAGALTNTAAATGTSDGIGLLAQASLTINFIPRPEITLTKVGTAPSKMTAGELIQYVFTITNSGNVKLNQPFSVNDPLAGVVTCANQADLTVGASTTCTGDYPITQQDLNNRSVVNTATATAYWGTFRVDSPQATSTVLLPELILTMTADPLEITGLGQTITYTYTLFNRTTKPMTNLVVTASRGPTNFQCLASLDGRVTASCTRTYNTYTQADLDIGFISNTADAHADATAPPRTVSTNSYTVSIPVTQRKELTLTKTADRTQATNIGDVITYSYSIKNTGNVTLTGPFGVVDDKIPAVNCTSIATLLPNASASCANATYTVTADDVLLRGVVTNKATATGKYLGTTVTSLPATVTVVTYPYARLGLKKSADPAYFTAANQTLNYSFTLVNTGGVQLNGPYSVTDAKIPGGPVCPSGVVIPVGGSIACTGSYLVTSGESLLEKVVNNATAASAYEGTTLVPATTPGSASLTVPKFVCNNTRVKHPYSTKIPDGSVVDFTLVNNSGIALNITGISISWAMAAPTLQQVQVGATTAFSGNSFASGGFNVPGQPWPLPTSGTTIHLQFSGPASLIHIVVSVSGPGCSLAVDSDQVYGS